MDNDLLLPIPAEVLEILRDTYTDEGCVIWWNSRNRRLRGIPRQLWEDGKRERVMAEADSLRGMIAT